ncbi:relaxase/mobilization nuclease domain-containing protein [Rhizosphaericola mali]|uniref:MobA/VirD2-like nuclease domain-containing protein n=1 Tax=Rhizosphaericola mali TaxID=2545455 RepID=A0A5P2FVU6_9BACT|nr:hypothetical protein [Rhizosphaericola mali]QES87634.1 hypothetical protein E0W69_002765 [Rhizosphaericola mali]
MIAKQTRGSAGSCPRMVDYALREKGLKHPDEKANIVVQNGCYGSHAEIKEQMKMAMELNKGKCQSPMFHAIFSLAENERLTKDQELALAEKLVKEFKLENSIVLGVKHASSENKDHYHFIVCLPPIDGKATPNMFKSKIRLMEIARSCELEFGLKQVETPKIGIDPKQRLRNNARFEKARQDLGKALIGTKSMLEFVAKMNGVGYSLRKGRGLGIVEDKTGIYYKASDLGLSLQKIEKIIAFNKIQEKQYENPAFRMDSIYQQKMSSPSNGNTTKSQELSSFNIIETLLNHIGKTMQAEDFYGGSISLSETEEEKLKKLKRKRGIRR